MRVCIPRDRLHGGTSMAESVPVCRHDNVPGLPPEELSQVIKTGEHGK